MQAYNYETAYAPPRRGRVLDTLIQFFDYILNSLVRRKQILYTSAAPICTTGTCPMTSTTGWGGEKLVAAERLPGERIREVDIVTRQRVKETHEKSSKTRYLFTK
jgi:hypothetical protein